MKIKTPLLTVVIGAGLAFGVSAQTKQPGEIVSLNSLPAAVQETIKDKAAGGEIVQIKREDDANGKWNYGLCAMTKGDAVCGLWLSGYNISQPKRMSMTAVLVGVFGTVQ